MGLAIYQVDAFTDKPFAGNPAGVCILTEPADEAWMQNVAREMNLSETAFLVEQPDGFSLRWFTPAAEVALCGHATLASAHTLWETGCMPPTQTARFHTKSGLLTAVKKGEWIKMDFPTRPEKPSDAPAELMKALGVNSRYTGKNVYDYIVEVDSDETVRNMQPDITLLRQIPVRGVIVTSRSADPRFDFISRFFAPGVGVDEDPVTGSAHCCLAPFWSSRLNKNEFSAYQASRRGGVLKVRYAGERTFIAGQAVTVIKGELV